MFEFVYLSIEKAVQVLGTLGYPGVFLMSFLDRLTVFLIPGEIVMPAFGILVNNGRFAFWPVMLWVTIGNFLGNVALYFVFLKGGRPFLEKYGKYLLISKHDLDHLDKFFLKYGEKVVFWGYFLPSSGRSIVPIPAGISRMKFSKFSFFTFFGSMPLNFLYVYLGVRVGDEFFSKTLVYFEKFNYVFVVLLVVLVIWYIYRHRKNKHLTHE